MRSGLVTDVIRVFRLYPYVHVQEKAKIIYYGNWLDISWLIGKFILFCPSCENPLCRSNQADNISLFYCDRCHTSFHMVDNILKSTKVEEQLPSLEVATRVYIDNKEHPFFLEHGLVTDVDHVHYRVMMISQNSDINGRRIWFPEHWVKALPKELLRHVKDEDLQKKQRKS